MDRAFLYVSFVFTWIFLSGCQNDPYNPDRFLSRDQQSKLIRESVYYSAKLPPNGTRQTKFNSEFNWYYDLAAREVELLQYFEDEKGTHYFLMSRRARSITPMVEGMGGKINYDDVGNLATYEEVFRTWKMPKDTLAVRGAFLFDRMVRGKDLSLYYSKFQGDKYIEFPNERFIFDKETQAWRDLVMDSVNLR